MAGVYQANRLDPWWDNVPYFDIFLYVHIILVVYIVLAFLELVSYYIIGFDNIGRFRVKLGWDKKILNHTVFGLLFFFLFIFFAALWYTLVWAVLAAILNPNKFLPYAAGAVTLFTTMTMKY